VSGQAQGAGLTARLAVENAVAAVRVAVRTVLLTGTEVPGWAGTVTGMLQDWSQQLGSGGRVAGPASAARTPGVLDLPAGLGVLAKSGVLAAPLAAYPRWTWLRLRFGVRRCLACGRLGNHGLQPAHPLVSPARARTWRCTDRDVCRQRRARQEEPR
jgi:hypothetical protein